jgi:hypothetical protein
MGRRTRERAAAMADLAVTVLGVAGFLGFLLAARMDDANASPFDVSAFAWFFVFGAFKACLPWLLSKRTASRHARDGFQHFRNYPKARHGASGDWPVGSALKDG